MRAGFFGGAGLEDAPRPAGQRRDAVTADRDRRRPPAALLLGAPARLPALRGRRRGGPGGLHAPRSGLPAGGARAGLQLGPAVPRPDHRLPAARALPLRRPPGRPEGAPPAAPPAGGSDVPG